MVGRSKKVDNIEFAAALRRLAQVYEENPELKQPYMLDDGEITIYCHQKYDFAEAVRVFSPGKKSDDNGMLNFDSDRADTGFRTFVRGFKTDICQRVVVGIRHVPETTVPAKAEEVIPAHDEEVVEWRCSPFLETEATEKVA